MQDWTGASQPRTPGTEAAPEAWTDPPSGPPRGAKPAAALDFLPDFLRLRARPLLSPDTRVSLVCLLPTPCGRAPSPTAQTLVAPDLPSAGTRSVFWKLGGGGGGGAEGGWCYGGSTGGGAGLTCLGCQLRRLGTPRPWPSPLASKPWVPHLSDADNRREK